MSLVNWDLSDSVGEIAVECVRPASTVEDMSWPTPPANPVADAIADECHELRDLLIAKNEAYGNSALDPVRIFSRADPVEQLKVRIDDKLSRLARGAGEADLEDAVQDLLGYLVLLRVARRLGA